MNNCCFRHLGGPTSSQPAVLGTCLSNTRRCSATVRKMDVQPLVCHLMAAKSGAVLHWFGPRCVIFFVFLYFWPNYPNSCPTTNPVEVISHWPRLSKTVAWTGRRRCSLPGFVVRPQHSVLLFFSSFLLRVEARSSPSQNVCSFFHRSFVSFFPPEAQTLNAFFFLWLWLGLWLLLLGAHVPVCVSMHPIGLFGCLVPEKRTSVSFIREKTFVSTGSPLRFDVHFHRRRPRRMRFIYDPDEDK